MNELENLVRDALVAHEPPSRDSIQLLVDVRSRVARRRQRGWSAAVLTAGATAAVITVIAVQAGPDGPSAPAAAATTGSIAEATPTPSAEPADDTQIVSFHGVEVLVPAAWTINNLKCGTPMGDTVVVNLTSSELCLVEQPPGLTVVTLRPYAADSPVAAVASSLTLVDGQPARRGVGTPLGFGESELSVLVLPDPGVTVTVESPDPTLAQQILDAVRLAPVDHNGCLGNVDMLQTPVSERPGAADALVPDQPTGASICRYSDDWLQDSASVAAGDLDSLMALLNSLAVGVSTPGPEFFESDDLCAQDQHRGFIVPFDYTDGAPVDVYVRISGCPVLSASNGARTTEVTDALETFLTTRVGYDGGYPDPRELR